MQPPRATSFVRKLRKRVVSRSFRVPPAVDRMLDKEAEKKGWTKSFLIRDIIVSWFNYHHARQKVEAAAGAGKLEGVHASDSAE